MRVSRPFRVLLVDDNPADLMLAQEVFAEHGERLTISTCASGEEALRALRGGPLPDVVILDVNMPVMSGFEVLQAIKDDPALLSIPVVMLSTSSQPGDVARAYTLHASSYMVKSNSFQKFVDQVDAFVSFWRESRTPSWPDRSGA
nr:response regulator [Deinococcus xianganensis]